MARTKQELIDDLVLLARRRYVAVDITFDDIKSVIERMDPSETQALVQAFNRRDDTRVGSALLNAAKRLIDDRVTQQVTNALSNDVLDLAELDKIIP